jgi:DNA-binding GntR family transcriptional regulator
MVQAASLAVQVYEDLRRCIGDGRIPAASRLSTAALRQPST